LIRVQANTRELDARIQKIALAVKDQSFDVAIDAAAWKAMRELVELTPKKWTGDTRRHWQVKNPRLGQRIVFNDSKVMLFLEGGTGQSTGGYIYPKTKKFLYIPLTQAASFGWRPGFIFGKDYVLAKRARGIRPMRIVEKFKPRATELLREEMKNFLGKILT
jgi:hypothetical protein